ncbi:arylamine N-acetyltransferase family protein [Lunatibacter salilacus]|uniref:arylamine N-acetyltransferase family protein n=1 Tax=Lunatibacter salilacus TaxID=2483804 RepID=UPI00131AAC6F|nr:arylamine N-acetyltransferase [Lunatibacter salilacus]
MSINYSRLGFSPFALPLSPSEVKTYLNRLGILSSPMPTLATLQQLHYLHPQVFTFESLNPLLGIDVDLDTAAIFQKMVVDGRGGYCFEQNLLFGALLHSLGFEVKSLAGRVLWNVPENKILPRDHMALMVRLEGQRFLVDVGFGGNTMTAPMLMDSDEPQPTSHEWFRVSRLDDQFMLSIQINGEWQEMYQFGLEEYLLPDYQVISWYLGNHPDSIFTKDLMAARTLHEGRYTLKNNLFSKHQKDGTTVKRILQTPKELLSLLENEFKININSLNDLTERLKSIQWD